MTVYLRDPAELAIFEAIRESFIISDGTRNLNVHYVNPLEHAEGMLIAYQPSEGLLFEADLVGTHQKTRTAPSADRRSFINAVRKLKLNVSRVVPVHGAPVAWSDVVAAQ